MIFALVFNIVIFLYIRSLKRKLKSQRHDRVTVKVKTVTEKRTFSQIRKEYFTYMFDQWMKKTFPGKQYSILNPQWFNPEMDIIRVKIDDDYIVIHNQSTKNNFSFVLNKANEKPEVLSLEERVNEWVATNASVIMKYEIETEKKGEDFFVIPYASYEKDDDKENAFIKALCSTLSDRGYISVSWDESRNIIVQMK